MCVSFVFNYFEPVATNSATCGNWFKITNKNNVGWKVVKNKIKLEDPLGSGVVCLCLIRITKQHSRIFVYN